MQDFQPGCSIAERTRNIDPVTGPGAVASHEPVDIDQPHRLQRDTQRSLRGVAANEFHPVFFSASPEALRERREPDLVLSRQRQREHEPRGFRTHGREIAQIDRYGLAGNVFRRGCLREVHALDKRIGSNREPFVTRQRYDGAVVADTEQYCFRTGL